MDKLPINFRPIGAIHDHMAIKNKNSLMLYRSGDLSRHGDIVSGLVKDFEIDCLIDLRAEDEKVPFPIHVLKDRSVEYCNFPLTDPDRSVRDAQTPDFSIYGHCYYHLVKNNIQKIMAIFNLLIHSSHNRFILFCYAGKDRTGILSAIILFLLGVPTSLITTDYEMSSSYLLSNLASFEKNWLKRNISPEIYKNRFKVDVRAILLMFHYFSKNEGGMLTYLQHHGLNEIDIIVLRNKFKLHKSALLGPANHIANDFWSLS